MKRLRGSAVGLAMLALQGCLEPPITETLDLRLLPEGTPIVSVTVVLRDPDDYGKAPKIQQRLAGEAHALADGTDAWSERFRAASPVQQRDVWDRYEGTVRRVVRHARLEGEDDLKAFLRDTGVGYTYASGEGWAELTLTPGRTDRATSSQKQRVRTALAAWSEKLAAYLETTRALYHYLDGDPDRARPCLSALFSVREDGPELTDEEEALVDAAGDALSAIGEVLEPAEGEAYTMDELSRLAYDPFPAPVRVTVPGRIVERDGFTGPLEAPLTIPALSLWSAFERLEGRWVFPDPALAMWRHDASGSGEPLDVGAFAATARRAEVAPTALEVQRAIEALLRPEPAYRVRWEPVAGDDEDDGMDPVFGGR